MSEIQPCENCGDSSAEKDGDEALYLAAREGSRASSGGWRFERLCTDCAPKVPLTTAGGRWGDE